MNKKLSFKNIIIAALLVMMALSACGKKEAPVVEEPAEDIEAEAAVEAAEEQPEEEDPTLPYFERKKLVTELSRKFSAPFYIYTATEEGVEDKKSKAVTWKQSVANYELGEITVTDPDEDGFVIYTVPLTAEFTVEGVANTEDFFKYGYSLEGLTFFDYETGRVYLADEYTRSNTFVSEEGVWSGNVYTQKVTMNSEYTISLKEDNEGLMIAFPLSGRNECRMIPVQVSGDKILEDNFLKRLGAKAADMIFFSTK